MLQLVRPVVIQGLPPFAGLQAISADPGFAWAGPGFPDASWQRRRSVLDRITNHETRLVRGVGDEVRSDVEGSKRCIGR